MRACLLDPYLPRTRRMALTRAGIPSSVRAARRSAVYGQAPPAGPQWVSRLAPLEPQALGYEKPLCASLDGFTLHAATRACALDAAGREALLHYVLRPPVAQERVEQRPDGLVRITLKKAYTDGTVAVAWRRRRRGQPSLRHGAPGCGGTGRAGRSPWIGRCRTRTGPAASSARVRPCRPAWIGDRARPRR